MKPQTVVEPAIEQLENEQEPSPQMQAAQEPEPSPGNVRDHR